MTKVTQHGADRVRERVGVPKRAVARMADKAFADGAKHSDFAGSMRRYLDGVFLEHGNANNMRVYNQHLFLFAGATLITAWPVPQKYRSAALKVCARTSESAHV